MHSTNAADYYVAWDTGSDLNNGTGMATAWRSLEKVGIEIGNIPDGSTIHFKRGGTYRGNVGFSGRNDLTFIGDWGTGNVPVLSGGVLIPNGNWQPSLACTGCYEATFTGTVKNLYVLMGGTSQLQTLARFPNADAIDNGLMRTDAYSTYLIDDNDLPARPNGYWNGAGVVLRVANWAHEVASINGYDDGLKELYLGSPVSMPINSPTDGWGYFLVNKLEELDQEGEWFHDGSTLFFRAPGSGAPQDVEASVHEDGFLVQNSVNITFQDLAFEKNWRAAIKPYLTSGVKVLNCIFQHSMHGINDESNGDPLNNGHQYNYNEFTTIYGTAVRSDAYDSEFIGNTLLDIGLWPGLAEPGYNTLGAMGISTGSGAIVEENHLENIGYMGITTGGTNGRIKQNMVLNALRTLNDGGGISFDDCDGLEVSYNIIDGLGHPDNLISTSANSGVHFQIGPGIYFGDNAITNTVVQWNTVTRCERGIMVDHTFDSQNNVIQNNTLFDNGIQLALSDYSNCHGTGGLGCGGGQGTGVNYQAAYNDRYHHNIMYALNADQRCLSITNAWADSWADLVDFGTFTDNYYFNPFSDVPIWIHKYWDFATDGDAAPNESTFARTFLQWRQETGEDLNAHIHPQHLKDYQVTSSSGTPIVVEGDFTNGISDLVSWDWPVCLSDACGSRSITTMNGSNAMLSTDCRYIEEACTATALQPGESGDYLLRFTMRSAEPAAMRATLRYSSATGYDQGQYFGVDPEPRTYEIPLSLVESGDDYKYAIFLDEEYANGVRGSSAITIDNVEVLSCTLDPDYGTNVIRTEHILHYNDPLADDPYTPLDLSAAPYNGGCWSDVYGNIYSGTVSVDPWESIVLFKLDTDYDIDVTQYTVSGTEIWDTDRNVRGSVVVPDGATLIVDHATVGFAGSDDPVETDLNVEPGGTLILRNGALFMSVPGSNCEPTMWNGAKALGNGTTIGAGMAHVLSGSGITDALCAIRCADGDPLNPLVGDVGSGGIVIAEDAYFDNNRFDIATRPHADINPLVWGPSSFTNCRFSRTRPLHVLSLDEGGVHVSLMGSANVALEGCIFPDASGTGHLQPDQWPMGIHAINTQVKVSDHAASGRRSSFSGTSLGLLHSTIDPSKAAVVNATDFNGNLRGLMMMGTDFGRVTLCTFDVPDLAASWAGYPAAYGSYLWGCKDFEFEENVFKGNDTNEPKVGSLFVECGPFFNQFYNNKYDGFRGSSPAGYSAGTIIMGDNYDDVTEEGLHIKCNDYSTITENDYDVAFTDVDPTIAKFQGANINTTTLAGNTFKVVAQDPDPGCSADPEQHLYVELNGINTFTYWHHQEQPGTLELQPHCATDPPIETTAGPSAWLQDAGIPYAKASACPLDLSPVPAAPDLPDQIIASEAELEDLEDVYGDWSDGGDPNGLIEFIEDPANDSYAVRNQLMLVAPKVSEDAWTAAFERTPPMIPWHMAQALIANSPLTPEVIRMMEHYGMDSYYQDLVRGAQSGGVSMHTIYGSEISHFYGNKARGLNDLAAAALLGVEAQALEDAILMHQEHPSHHSDHSLLALHLALGDLASARDIVDLHLPTGELPEYWELQDLYLDLREQGMGPEDVEGDGIQALAAIASAEVYGSAHAQAWLSMLGGVFTETVILPRPYRSASYHSGSSGSAMPAMLEVHPNPSNGPVYVVVRMPEGAEDGTVRVMDPMGRLVLERNALERMQIIELTGKELASGLYTLGLSVDGIQAATAKFEVIR